MRHRISRLRLTSQGGSITKPKSHLKGPSASTRALQTAVTPPDIHVLVLGGPPFRRRAKVILVPSVSQSPRTLICSVERKGVQSLAAPRTWRIPGGHATLPAPTDMTRRRRSAQETYGFPKRDCQPGSVLKPERRPESEGKR